MKKHIKGFNIIRLLLACVIGIGAMNIGLISADDTRLVDEEAVKIEEVMSIGDDVSSISEVTPITSFANASILGNNRVTSGTTGWVAAGTWINIFYNGKFWGKSYAAASLSGTTGSILKWNGLTANALPVYTNIEYGTKDYFSSIILNSNATVSRTTTATNLTYCYYSYIILEGPEDFGEYGNITSFADASILGNSRVTSGTSGWVAAGTWINIFYNGKFWGKSYAAASLSGMTGSILKWNGLTANALPVYTNIEYGTKDYFSSIILNSNATVSRTTTATNLTYCYYSYIILEGPEDFGIDNSYGDSFGSGTSSAKPYDISKGSASNGSFVVASSAYEDTTVTVGTTPNTGYKLNSVSVPGASNIVISGNNATFTMPGAIFLFF